MDYEHRYWGAAHGLPHASVRAIQQTPDGYLWVATEYGLARFNGAQFLTFTPKNEPALDRPFLNCLSVQPGGALWSGSEGGGLIVYDKGRFTNISTNEGLAGVAVRGLVPRAQGGLWVLCDRGLNLWTTGGLETINIRDLPDKTVNLSLLEDQQGQLWLGTDRGLFGPMHPKRPRAVPVNGLTARQVHALAALPLGQLWAGTDEGLFEVMDDRGGATARLVTALRSAKVKALYADRHNVLWLGTTTGLRRLRQGQLVEEEAIPLFRNTTIFSFHEDREANLWIGAGNGLHSFHDRTFATISAREGLEDEEVVTITQTSPARFLLGTQKGEVYALENGKVRPLPEYRRNSLISAIWQDQKKRLWIATRRDGLIGHQNGQSTAYGLAQGLRDLNIFAVVEDPKGVLWVGTQKGLNCWQDGRFVPVDLPVPAGQEQPIIRSLFVARDGTLWAGTQDGLYHLKPENTNYYGRAEGFPASLVYYITEDKKGRLWLGTTQGIIHREGGQWRLYKPDNNFSTHHVFWLALDEQGFLWYSTPWSIFRLETARLQAYWQGRQPLPTPLIFTHSDGLLAMECLGGRQSAGCQTHDGRLIFPTRRGLAIANPKDAAAGIHPPRVVIERILVNGRDYPISPFLELAPGSHTLEIHFAGLSFRQPERVNHRYQLTGVDKEWVEAYHRRNATYVHLAPGRYEFRVTADDGHGVWSVAGAGVEFLIKPHFYQTGWFYGVVVGLLAASIYGGHEWRLRALKRRNAWLTARLAERTRELEQSLAERLHLEQAALARKQQETMGQLAAGIAHHLNNQLQAIQSSSALLQEPGNEPAEVQEQFGYIDGAVAKSAYIIEQLLSYGQRHWLRKTTLNLREYLPSLLSRYPADRLQVEWPKNLPEVLADTHILEQAFTAVLTNAFEANSPRATVQVRIQVVQRHPPDTAASPPPTGTPPTFVQLEIRDTGPGLSASAQAHLFEPFFTTKDVGQGTGLGLAAAYGGLRQIGGWIDAANRPEGGCTVSLFLPVAAAAPSPAT